MGNWGSGYVTDIEYADGFYAAQSPSHLALAATINGIESPDFDTPFTCCELGCGRGQTSLVLAALNPESEFHAVDFHPSHIAYAQEQARRAQLNNITLHECSFADLTGGRGPSLPMFDVITMHGVWSWIAPELQQAILNFINARLKPGGFVYVSYNALPAWNHVMPLQKVVRELAGTAPERSDFAVARALEQLSRLAELKIIPERYQSEIKRMRSSVHSMLSYLAHEYLNEHWQPLYHADVVRSLAGAKLSFAACTDLLKNFYNLSLTEEQRKYLADVPVAEVRETLKDFCTDHWFRQDLFVRGIRRMSADKREKRLLAQQLTLLRPATEMIEVNRPDGSKWVPDPRVYQAVIQALGERPRTLRELLTLEGLPRDHQVGPVELVGVLVGVGIAGFYKKPSIAEQAAADRFNALQNSDEEAALSKGLTLAVPAARTGVTLSAAHYALYSALRRGESPSASALAESFIERCRARGGHPVIDGEEIRDDDKALTAVTKDYQLKIDRLVPVWRGMGIV